MGYVHRHQGRGAEHHPHDDVDGRQAIDDDTMNNHTKGHTTMHRSIRKIHALALLAAPALLATPLIGVQAATVQVRPHATVQVAIQNFAFSPQTLTVAPGTTVVWTQKDSAPHTVTSDTGAWAASADLHAGQTFSHTFTTAGTLRLPLRRASQHDRDHRRVEPWRDRRDRQRGVHGRGDGVARAGG